jgi:hypothetical protein
LPALNTKSATNGSQDGRVSLVQKKRQIHRA